VAEQEVSAVARVNIEKLLKFCHKTENNQPFIQQIPRVYQKTYDEQGQLIKKEQA